MRSTWVKCYGLLSKDLDVDTFKRAIKRSLEDENWFAALFTALAVPDICGNIEANAHGTNASHRSRYEEWCNLYLDANYKHLNGEVFWQLRCSEIHAGKHVDNRLKKTLSGAELLLVTYRESPFHDSFVQLSEEEAYVFMRVDVFCKEICSAIDAWAEANQDNALVKEEISKLSALEKGWKAKQMILGRVSLNYGKHIISGIYCDIPNKKGFRPLWSKT